MVVIDMRRQNLQERWRHLDQDERQGDQPRQSIESVGTVNDSVERFIARDKVCDSADLFAPELSFQTLTLLRQGTVHLVKIAVDLLDAPPHRLLLGLCVLKSGAGTGYTSSA